MCTVKKLFVVNFLFVNFVFKFFYAVPPLRLTPPCIYMHTCNAERQRRSPKGSKLKKKTGLCPSRFFYYSIVFGVRASGRGDVAMQPASW